MSVEFLSYNVQKGNSTEGENERNDDSIVPLCLVLTRRMNIGVMLLVPNQKAWENFVTNH